jgi:hypothetical protein
MTLFDYSDRNPEYSITNVVKWLNSIFIGDLSTVLGALGVQMAPYAFESNFNTIGNEVRTPGTFVLWISDKYQLRNLVVKEFSVKLSSFKRRNGDGTASQPLYADIDIGLEFCTMMTADDINNMILSNSSNSQSNV